MALAFYNTGCYLFKKIINLLYKEKNQLQNEKYCVCTNIYVEV